MAPFRRPKLTVMSGLGGGRRGAYAAAAAAFFTVIGVLALVIGLRGTATPPQPSAAQAGTLSGLGRGVAGNAGASSQSSPRGTSPGSVAPGSVAPGAAGVPASPSPGRASSLAPLGPVLSRSLPVRLDIASIGVHTSLLQLSLNPDGSLQVPWRPLLAGWFSHSPTPGQVGPSVIAGHVDSWQTGPAVFYRLGSLAPGNPVVVTRADGSRATFLVDGVREYPKDHFPTGPVYGNTDRAELRLITCGDWNASRQEYDGNIVAFAHLVSGSRS